MALSACSSMTNMPPLAAVSPSAQVAVASPVSGGGPVSLEQAIANLATAVQALAQALAGSALLAVPATATPGVIGGGGAPSVGLPVQQTPAQGGQVVQQSPVQQSPIQQSPVQSGPRGANDGPGVHRKLLSKQELERDPKLRGKLDPPTGGKPPKGVQVRTNAAGARVVTINIHGGVPGGKGLAPRNESIAGLRDIARYVNSIDADVVMMQEVNDRPFNPKDPGVSAVTSVLYHLMGATDMAMTPGSGAKGTRRDSAMFTRNGYTIERAMNVDLPDRGDPARRSAGVAVVQPPDGSPAFTAINTHMSHMPTQAASDRRHAQLVEINRVAEQIRQHGGFTYSVPNGGRHTATGFPQDRLVFGGDLNTTRRGRHANDSADRELRGSGLRHANDLAARGQARAAIDHLYVRGFDVATVASGEIARRELATGSPTDHPAVVTDLG